MNIYTKIFSVFALVALIILPGCWTSKKEEKKAELVVINVLDEKLYNDCHIKGSINVPFEMIEEYARNLDKDAEIVLYCSNYQCATSEYAAKKLRQRGFTKVCVYEGGMAEWFQNELPVEGPSTKDYLRKPCKNLAECDVMRRNETTASRTNDSVIEIISLHDLAHKMGLCTKCEHSAA